MVVMSQVMRSRMGNSNPINRMIKNQSARRHRQ
jgi:hypothetical protein